MKKILILFFILSSPLYCQENHNDCQDQKKENKEDKGDTATPSGKESNGKNSNNGGDDTCQKSEKEENKDTKNGNGNGKESKDEKSNDCKEEKSKANEEKSDDCPEDSKDEKEEPPKIGNFSLPMSQQPAALFGFGGNILDAQEVQIYLFVDTLVGRKKMLIDVIPSVLFGVTDNFSVFFNAPFTPQVREGNHHSSGLLDFFIQLEYAFYNNSTYTYSDEATLVGNVTAPTGSINVNPPTGFGGPSLFLGMTFMRTWVHWFAFTAQGAVLTTSNLGFKPGEQFLYQFGFGRNFPSPEDHIYAWMIEVDGQYNKKSYFRREWDGSSGGNTVWITPSLWASSKDWLIQFGVSFPMVQNLFGEQRKFEYIVNFNWAWSFYPTKK